MVARVFCPRLSTSAWAFLGRLHLSYVLFALGFELLNREVTFTSGMFQVLAAQDSHRSAPVLDKSGLLQNPGRNANACTSRPEHAGQKFVRKGQQRGANPFLAHQ